MKFEMTPEDVEMVSQFFKGSKLERSVIKIIMREELTPEERLEGLAPEAIEAYLQKIKQNQQS